LFFDENQDKIPSNMLLRLKSFLEVGMSKFLLIVAVVLSFSGFSQGQSGPAKGDPVKLDVVLTTGWVGGFGVVEINSLSNHTAEVTYVRDNGPTCPKGIM
jgi:hypothetical protein